MSKLLLIWLQVWDEEEVRKSKVTLFGVNKGSSLADLVREANGAYSDYYGDHHHSPIERLAGEVYEGVSLIALRPDEVLDTSFDEVVACMYWKRP